MLEEHIKKTDAPSYYVYEHIEEKHTHTRDSNSLAWVNRIFIDKLSEGTFKYRNIIEGKNL